MTDIHLHQTHSDKLLPKYLQHLIHHISGILKNRKFLIRNNSCIMCCLCQHLIPLFDVSPDNKSSVIFVQFIKMVSNLLPVCLDCKIISTTNKNNNSYRYYYEKPKSVQKLNTLSPVSSS